MIRKLAPRFLNCDGAYQVCIWNANRSILIADPPSRHHPQEARSRKPEPASRSAAGLLPPPPMTACYTTRGPIGHGCEIETHPAGEDRGEATAGARRARGCRGAAAASRARAPDDGGGGSPAAARLLADDGLRVPARRLRALPDERLAERSQQHPARVRDRPRSAAQG